MQKSAIPFTRHPEGSLNSKAHFGFYLWNGSVFLFSSAGLCVLCLLLGIGMMDIQLFFDYFRHPLLFVINWLPILLLQLLLMCLFNYQCLAFLGAALLFVTAAVGDFYKLRFRSEPFLFSDLSMASAGLHVSENYDMTPNLRILLSIVLVLLGFLFLLLFARGRLHHISRRVLALAVLLSLYPLWRWVYTDESLYNSPALSSGHVVNGWTQQLQVSKGFLYQFVFSSGEGRHWVPEGYREVDVEASLSTVRDADIPEERKVSLLVFQLESFTDLRELGIGGISETTYADFDRLKAESLSGHLVANVFAGGTVDSERCFLTGSTYMHDYERPAPSYVWYLDEQGYTTIGSHPNFGTFYNRVNINQYLGFSDYRFRENYYENLVAALPDPWQSDHIVIPQITDEFIWYLHRGVPVFSFNVTMQGHGPYSTTERVYDQVFWENSVYSDTANCVLNNYLGSVHETSSLLWDTVETLRQDAAPVVLLLYGDHKPWLGDDNAVYRELGINLDLSTDGGCLNYYSTPYLIWANDAARSMLGSDFTGESPTISPGFLMKLLFDQLGWEGNSYMQLSGRAYSLLPVMHTSGFYLENGHFTDELSTEAAKALNNLEYLEYYMEEHFSPPNIS